VDRATFAKRMILLFSSLVLSQIIGAAFIKIGLPKMVALKEIREMKIASRKRIPKNGWIHSHLTDQFFKGSWKFTRDSYGISGDAEMPQVVINSAGPTAGCINGDYCTIGYYYDDAKTVVIYPYRIAYLKNISLSRPLSDKESRKLLAEIKVALFHEFLHYIHTRLDLIPFGYSHAVMFSDQRKVKKVFCQIADEYKVDPKPILDDEIKYLKKVALNSSR